MIPVIPMMQSIRCGLVTDLLVGTTYEWWNKPWTSGFHKHAVVNEVGLGPLGLYGDAPADQAHHGGPDKAVCAYPPASGGLSSLDARMWIPRRIQHHRPAALALRPRCHTLLSRPLRQRLSEPDLTEWRANSACFSTVRQQEVSFSLRVFPVPSFYSDSTNSARSSISRAERCEVVPCRSAGLKVVKTSLTETARPSCR